MNKIEIKKSVLNSNQYDVITTQNEHQWYVVFTGSEADCAIVAAGFIKVGYQLAA